VTRRGAAVDGLVLAGPVVAVLGLVLLAAGAPSALVPAARGGFPEWLAGPLRGLVSRAPGELGALLMLGLVAAYAVAVSRAGRLGLRGVLVAVAAAHLALLAGPPLLSGDVFGYLGYARLGVLHDVSPYTHGGLSLGPDVVHPFVLWRNAYSPYGPAFTLLTYALVPLGVAGGLWALKVVSVLASLACVGIVASAAPSPARAAALVGLNPVLLAYAVGGAHNDLVVAALLAAAAALLLHRRGVPAAALAMGAATVKLSALIVVPYAVASARDRPRAALAAAGVGVLAVAGALAAFGASAGGMAAALARDQGAVTAHSVPGFVIRALGEGSLPAPARIALTGGLALVVVITLRRTWRGGDPVAGAGWATVALLVTTTWLLPWYLVWVLPFAALTEDRRLEWAVLALTGYLVLTRVAALG
jgi:Glycosyltransferase family 87